MKICKVRNVKTPQRGTEESAGIDFFVPDDYPTNLCSIQPGERFFIPSGFKANVPTGYALIAFNKSGVALNKGLMVGASVVDSDYQGEIHLHLVNTSAKNAEMVKYLTNTFLATKVSFANEMKNICDSLELDFDEVVKRANNNDLGLASYVYTNNLEKAHKASELMETGTVAVNTAVVALPEAPFGGIKQTGYGREGGSMAIKDYLNVKYTHLGIKG